MIRRPLSSLSSALIALAWLGPTLFTPRPALGYIRSVTDTGAPLAWTTPCVHLTLMIGSRPADVPVNLLTGAAVGAAHAWSGVPTGQAACSKLNFDIGINPGNAVVPQKNSAGNIKVDGASRLMFLDDDWCPTMRGPEDLCFEGAALAITLTSADRASGAIVDADVLVNARDFTWSDLVSGGSTTGQDLQNTLTHEFGHVIGLDHPCYSAGGPIPTGPDDQGNPAGACAAAPQEIKDATMYPSVMRGDVVRRDLADDDLRAVCAVYPGTAAATCEPLSDGGGGCTLARARLDSGPCAPLVVVLAAAAALLGIVGRGLRSARRARRRWRRAI